MRFLAFAAVAALTSFSFAAAQDDTPPPVSNGSDIDGDPADSASASSQVQGDPALDALGETPAEENELDQLSKSPDDAFQDLNETKQRVGVSVTLRALDKITAQYKDIEAPIGQPVKFGALEILPHYCDKRPPEEFPETTAFLEIFDREHSRAAPAYKDPALAAALAETNEPKEVRPVSDDYSVDESVPAKPFGAQDGEGSGAADGNNQDTDDIPAAPGALPPQAGALPPGATPAVSDAPTTPVDPDRIFSGWMFASSPSLNALQNPVYDVWVIDCKTELVDR